MYECRRAGAFSGILHFCGPAGMCFCFFQIGRYFDAVRLLAGSGAAFLCKMPSAGIKKRSGAGRKRALWLPELGNRGLMSVKFGIKSGLLSAEGGGSAGKVGERGNVNGV